MFSGRLTDEVLLLRLKGKRLLDIRELDLSQCKLKDFSNMFDNVKCPNVREINLNYNFMTSLKSFGFLPSLKILRLKSNRLETLFLKPGLDEKNFRKGLLGLPGLEMLDVS
jgi:Leucine-rich repeat (LRR) protein